MYHHWLTEKTEVEILREKVKQLEEENQKLLLENQRLPSGSLDIFRSKPDPWGKVRSPQFPEDKISYMDIHQDKHDWVERQKKAFLERNLMLARYDFSTLN